MNKNMFRILSVALAAGFMVACVDAPEIDFNIDSSLIEVGPEGGVKTINVESSDNWVATVQVPWITVSPANGKGSVECRVMIDSALAVTPRETKVRIENLVTGERMDFNVKQDGFPYEISIDKPELTVESYKELADRNFTVKVRTNVRFAVELDEEAKKWISYEQPEVNLDRGARPREVPVKFKWEVNFNQDHRSSVIKFRALDEQIAATVSNQLELRQNAAEKIEVGVKGDSLSLIAINRALGCWTPLETSEKMEFWEGVEVWKSGPNKGRVKKAEFFLFNTKEGIPFQVKYLTAAEELYFYSNVNTFLLSLDPGEHICELTNLRKLTIGAYGLSTLPESFRNLKNLEYLDVSGNNFQNIPEVLSEENFPKLTALIMNSCKRNSIYDLSNTNKTNFGGLFDESDVDDKGNKSFPKRLLKWNKLDTLRISVNYIEGVIPDLMDDPQFPKWTAEEVAACDTLPDRLIGLPKVLADTDMFAINLNNLHGNIPDWLLYHPKLDLWYPTALVFPQEGKTSYGTSAGFDNVPANMDYYYDVYVNKKYNPANNSEESEDE